MFSRTSHNDDDDDDVINVLLKRSSVTTRFDRRRLRYRSRSLYYKHNTCNIYLYINKHRIVTEQSEKHKKKKNI
jgi:hypothetical protein